ncbi:MAG TPA: Hsp20/alpha crystallin family protein [Polyangiaceae bacterium]|nr:Hsp20/alpha crystallin family protein [Polyangiaceae bacterium]
MSEQNTAVETAEATPRGPTRRATPPVDVFENDEGFLIVADLPGVSPEALEVEFEPPELRVSGRAPGPDGDEVVYERRFELGASLDASSISAELTNGVLRIEIKKSAALRPRRIDVRAA